MYVQNIKEMRESDVHFAVLLFITMPLPYDSLFDTGYRHFIADLELGVRTLATSPTCGGTGRLELWLARRGRHQRSGPRAAGQLCVFGRCLFNEMQRILVHRAPNLYLSEFRLLTFVYMLELALGNRLNCPLSEKKTALKLHNCKAISQFIAFIIINGNMV